MSYLIGSFPTAYVIGKHLRNIDISKSGSRNVGARNAYEVTGSKSIGITVGSIDILKGFLVTLLWTHIYGLSLGLTAAVFVVLGHNYSVFLKFKGGRGLATGAGSLLVLQPLTIPLYLAVYFLLRKLGIRLYLASVTAILAAFMILLLEVSSDPSAIVLSAMLAGVILSKHIVPLKNEFQDA